MHLFTVSATVVASLTMFQFCPAPPPVLGPIIGGALAGEAGGIVGYGVRKISKKHSFEGSVFEKCADLFEGLPEPAADICKSQLQGIMVQFTPTGQGAFCIDNVPSACMILLNVILGQDPEQPAPTPMGSAVLGYSGLSDDDINKLQAALDGKGY